MHRYMSRLLIWIFNLKQFNLLCIAGDQYLHKLNLGQYLKVQVACSLQA